MVDRVIRDYMEGGAKKLTVPGFGTFMRKDTGDGRNAACEIIFVDLLRRDDGKLAELVEDYGHYSELEAMALIDRFIFETKNGIERDGSATIDGFGTMTLDHKGLYQFDYSPRPRHVKETAVQEKLFGKDELQPVAKRPESQPKSSERRVKAPTEARVSTANRREKAKRPRHLDLIIIVAVVAAIIALGIIIWSSSVGNMPFQNR